MSSQTLKLETLKDVLLEKIIRQVLEGRQKLTIWVSDKQAVIIEPKPRLKPLSILAGYIPPGWKDAILKTE